MLLGSWLLGWEMAGEPYSLAILAKYYAVTGRLSKLRIPAARLVQVTDGRKSATNDCPAVATMFVTTAAAANGEPQGVLLAQPSVNQMMRWW